eukprot:6196211-Pleurochrysis_carterae.AAC.1
MLSIRTRHKIGSAGLSSAPKENVARVQSVVWRATRALRARASRPTQDTAYLRKYEDNSRSMETTTKVINVPTNGAKLRQAFIEPKSRLFTLLVSTPRPCAWAQRRC